MLLGWRLGAAPFLDQLEALVRFVLLGMFELVRDADEPEESDERRIVEALGRMAKNFDRLGDPGAFHRTPERVRRVLQIESIEDAREAFYGGSRSPRMPFVVNDAVRVTRGDAKGLIGAVISVEQIEPEFRYLVESAKDGSDAVFPAADLQLLDANGPTEFNSAR